MNLRTCLLTKNQCYTAGRTITPKGVLVHSTGANNPNLRRYVQPDDGLLGVNPNGNDWNRAGMNVCVHAFIGKLADGSVATYQTLPWNRRGWHAAGGKRGSANNTHIAFEICEDSLNDAAYFAAVYREAVELTAYLCKRYKLDPRKDGVVICHQEGCRRGIASNHGDVLHWFPKFGKTMDAFRADVARTMIGEDEMTEKQVRELIDRALAERDEAVVKAARTVSPWAKEAWGKAVAAGVFDGTRPGAALTREQAATVFDRMGLVKGD